MNKDRETIIIVRKKKVARPRPSRRRVEGGLRRLHDVDDGALPGPLARHPELGRPLRDRRLLPGPARPGRRVRQLDHPGRGRAGGEPAPDPADPDHRPPARPAPGTRRADPTGARASRPSFGDIGQADRDRPHRARGSGSSSSRTRAASSSRPAARTPGRRRRAAGPARRAARHDAQLGDGGRLHRRGTVLDCQATYTNWELSSDRANTARRILVAGGLHERPDGAGAGPCRPRSSDARPIRRRRATGG